MLAACVAETPYADHSTHACVASCQPGSFGNAEKDCEGLECVDLVAARAACMCCRHA